MVKFYATVPAFFAVSCRSGVGSFRRLRHIFERHRRQNQDLRPFLILQNRKKLPIRRDIEIRCIRFCLNMPPKPLKNNLPY